MIGQSDIVHSAYIDTTHKLSRVCDASAESLLTRIFRARFGVAYCGKILVHFLHEVSMEQLGTEHAFLLCGHSHVQHKQLCMHAFMRICINRLALDLPREAPTVVELRGTAKSPVHTLADSNACMIT